MGGEKSSGESTDEGDVIDDEGDAHCFVTFIVLHSIETHTTTEQYPSLYIII